MPRAPKTRQLVVRIEDDLQERIAAYVQRLRAETGGVEVPEAAAVRHLLALGLEAVELEVSKPSKPTKPKRR